MKLRLGRKRALAGAAAMALAASLAPAPSVSAGVGDVILNPGAFTMKVEGGFINFAGNEFALRATADPARCNNDQNDDTSQNGGDPQDLNEDWDGNGGTADSNCNGLNNTLKAADDSEVKPTNQVKQQITITGSVDQDGVVDLSGVTIPPEYLFARIDPVGDPSGGGLILDITFTSDTSGTNEGSINPETGAATLDVAFNMRIVQAFFGIDCTIGPIAMTLTTDPSAPENGGVIPVSPVDYNVADGSVTVSNNIYTMPAAVNTDPLSTSNACTNIIDPGFNLPAASGESAAQFLSMSTPIALSGVTDTITGTVTEYSGGAPIEGISVRLNDATTNVTVDKVSTDAAGKFTFYNVPIGDYIVRYVDLDGLHIPLFWEGQPTRFTAGTITATGGVTHSGVDQEMETTGTGSFTGTVTEEGSGTPLESISVRLLTPTNVLIATRNTKADGTYLFSFHDFATYTMRFIDPSLTYGGEFHLDGATRFDATPIVHSSWFTTVDAELALVP